MAVAQYVIKWWPTDLALLGLRHAVVENLFSHKMGCTAHRLTLPDFHRPGLTEILFKRL